MWEQNTLGAYTAGSSTGGTGNKIGDSFGGERWSGGAWVSEEEYQKLLESGDIARGQPEFQAIKKNLIDATGKVANAVSGAWEENVGKHIPDVDVELNEQTKEVLSTTKDVAGHVYNWTARPTVESAARGAGHLASLLDIGVQGAHWVSKKVDPTGRGIGTGPLGITEALLTLGGGALKSSGKGLLKYGDEIVEAGAKALRGPQLAYETIPVSPSVFNTKPLTTTNPMGIEGLSNMFQAKGVTTAVKSGEKAIRTQSTDLFDELNREIYGPEWDVLKEEGFEGMGRVYKGMDEQIVPKGQSTYIQQRLAELSPHHLSEKSFDLRNIKNLAKDIQLRFVRDLNSIDIFPGNHPRNWLGMFHDNTGTIMSRQKAAINQLRKDAGMPPLTKRQLDDWFKAPKTKAEVGELYGIKELTSKDLNIRAAALADLQAGTLKRDWSQILPPGKTIKDIKVHPSVISRDHQSLSHGITNNLESTLEIESLMKSGKWEKLSYKEMFLKKAKNSIEKQNVAFNVSLIRIQHIRKAMGNPDAPWDDIVAWMAKNPERAGSIGWHETLSKGGDVFNQLGKTKEQMIADLSPKDLRLVGNVFGIKDVPNSSKKLQELMKNWDKRSTVKAIQRDIDKGL